MSLQSDIQAALCARLVPVATVAQSDITSPATDVALPFVDPPFAPTLKVAYLEIHPILRAAPQHFGISYGNPDIHTGIFQVDAVVPKGTGEAQGLRLADAVASRFPIGTRLAAGDDSLEINNIPAIAPAIMDAPWVRFPVSIPYRVIA
jgi:hypothetical protein